MEAIRDRKFKKLRKYAAGHEGGVVERGGSPELEALGGWKVVVRSQNYVVPCNSHPNDSWMIKAGRRAR